MKRNLILLLLSFLSLTIFSENISKIDSIESRISSSTGLEKIELFIQLSKLYQNVDYDNCIINGQKAVVLAQKINAPNLEGKALKSMGVSCYILTKYQTALDFFLQAYDVFKKSGNILEQGNCLSNVGLIYDEWSNYPKAEKYYRQALDLKTKVGDKISIATTLINLGNISYYKYNYQKSLDYYYRAKLLFTESNDNEGVGQCLNNISIIFEAWGNISQAIEYLQETETLYKKTGNDFQLSKIYSNLADIYCDENKDYKQALTYYEKSLALKKNMDDQQGIAILFNNLGSLYGNMENFDKAEYYLNKSRKLYKKLNSLSGLVMIEQNEGKIAMMQKHYMLAKKHFLLSLSKAEEINLPNYISSNQEYLFKINAATGNYKEFTKYYNLFITGKDTILNQLNQAKMAKIEAKYRVEEQLIKTKELKAKNKESISQIHHYRLLLAGLIGTFVLIIVILISYLWYNKTK